MRCLLPLARQRSIGLGAVIDDLEIPRTNAIAEFLGGPDTGFRQNRPPSEMLGQRGFPEAANSRRKGSLQPLWKPCEPRIAPPMNCVPFRLNAKLRAMPRA